MVSKYCVFCLKLHENESSGQSEASYLGGDDRVHQFHILIARYLKIPDQLRNSFNFKRVDYKYPCETCFQLIESFSDLYFEMKCVELKVQMKIRTLLDIMRDAGKVSVRRKSLKKLVGNEEFRILSTQRKDWLLKCSERLFQCPPTISLKKSSSSTSNDQVTTHDSDSTMCRDCPADDIPRKKQKRSVCSTDDPHISIQRSTLLHEWLISLILVGTMLLGSCSNTTILNEISLIKLELADSEISEYPGKLEIEVIDKISTAQSSCTSDDGMDWVETNDGPHSPTMPEVPMGISTENGPSDKSPLAENLVILGSNITAVNSVKTALNTPLPSSKPDEVGVISISITNASLSPQTRSNELDVKKPPHGITCEDFSRLDDGSNHGSCLSTHSDLPMYDDPVIVNRLQTVDSNTVNPSRTISLQGTFNDVVIEEKKQTYSIKSCENISSANQVLPEMEHSPTHSLVAAEVAANANKEPMEVAPPEASDSTYNLRERKTVSTRVTEGSSNSDGDSSDEEYQNWTASDSDSCVGDSGSKLNNSPRMDVSLQKNPLGSGSTEGQKPALNPDIPHDLPEVPANYIFDEDYLNRCTKCSEEFDTPRQLEIHSTFHGTWKCQFCPTELDYARDLAIHEIENHKSHAQAWKLCPRCDFRITSKCSTEKGKELRVLVVIKHFVTKHLQLKAYPFECQVCLKTFSNKSNLGVHVKETHERLEEAEDDCFKCDKCSERFLTERKLVYHKRVAHKIGGGVGKEVGQPGPGRAFPCENEDCEWSFDSKEEMTCHKYFRCNYLKTLKKESRICQVCGKGFKGKAGLAFHIKKVHECPKAPLPKCDICDKTFRYNCDLKNHLEFHKGPEEWRFMCEVCSKKCVSKDKLVQHMRTHTQEKPFVCQVCGGKYAHKHNLQIHIKSKHKEVQLEVKKYTTRPGVSRKGKKLGKNFCFTRENDLAKPLEISPD